MLRSQVCKYEDFSQDWYRAQEELLKIRELYHDHAARSHDFANRKFWEWCSIAQALEERGFLRAGNRGLGFAVGTEPLTSYFASRQCTVLATDVAVSETTEMWAQHGQHAASLQALYYAQFLARPEFEERVAFMPVDMRELQDLTGIYDFLWSSCSFEHLGTLERGIEFVVQSSQLLREGGIAVHTTEFNVNSNTDTVEAGSNVVYRRRDIEELARRLEQVGCWLVPVDFDTGNHIYDFEFDRPPYMSGDRRHIKLLIDGYISTSVLLIIQRAYTRR